jgi:lysophospholipase L1-like esterase
MRALLRPLATAVALALPLALAAANPPVAAEESSFLLRDGDRVVFFGDSITEQRLWTRYVAQCVRCRYPERDVRFFNAGWGGDTARGGRARLARDVLELKPSVVLLFFGMNDGGYRAPDPAVAATYRENLAAIAAELRAKGVRVIVMSPGCVDDAARPPLAAAHYNDTLEALAKLAQSVAKETGSTFVDVHRPMRDYLDARRQAGIAASLVPDGVHPNDEGHLYVASVVLKGLGLETVPPLGTYDAAAGKGRGLERASKDDAEVLLRTTEPRPAPFWTAPASEQTFQASGLADLLSPRLTVTGLAAGRWEVTVGDADPVAFPAADLARGVTVPLRGSARGKSVHDFEQQREGNYFRLWRDVRLPLAGVPGVDEAVKGLLALDDGLHRSARDAAAPRPGTTVRLTPTPGGENLALGRKYESSDRNGRGWGEGGLTDGSWEADARHCFATGSAEDLPKTVTVDLEKAQRIGFVRLGVPPFGSTRTVRVSVSQRGKDFQDVGSVEFAQGSAQRRTVAFAPVSARWVRLTYTDRWPAEVQFPPAFAFTTELEVYAAN